MGATGTEKHPCTTGSPVCGGRGEAKLRKATREKLAQAMGLNLEQLV
jgi:hypothetical protein